MIHSLPLFSDTGETNDDEERTERINPKTNVEKLPGQ